MHGVSCGDDTMVEMQPTRSLFGALCIRLIYMRMKAVPILSRKVVVHRRICYSFYGFSQHRGVAHAR